MAALDDQLQQLLVKLQQQWTKAGQLFDPSYLGGLQQYWQQLNDTQKRDTLTLLQKQGGDPQSFSHAVLQLTQPGAQPPGPPAAATDPNAPSAQQQAAATAATSAATAPTAQLGEVTSGEQGYGIPVATTGAQSFTAGGTPTGGFNEMLQSYTVNAINEAGSDVNALAQVAGVDPATLQQQYRSYQAGMATARESYRGFGALAGDPQDIRASAQLTLPQFTQQVAQTTAGPWRAVLDAIGSVWSGEFQQALPVDLQQQIIGALNGLSADQKKTVLYQAMQYMENKASSVAGKGVFDLGGAMTAGLLSVLPASIMTYGGTSAAPGTGSVGTTGIVGTYAQLYPSPFFQKETVETKIASDFQQKLNRAPTAADLAALGSNPTDIQISQYIDAQPVPGTSMTYGTYSAVSNELTTQWQEYFGRDPTQKELLWAVGKSPEDITSFINNSQSSIPGLTIGRKNDYESFIDSLGTSGASSTTHAFSGTLDDSLIKDLHSQVTAASTGKAAPGPM